MTQSLRNALANRYRIERELGQGGMATVYLAHDLRHDRKVALKVLKPELAAVLGAERFVAEIKTTASLQHPHILPLFDSGQADGFLYYVMPFIEGETLREKLTRETQLGIEEAVLITTEVADALDYAHRHGVIHRDIKPENILLADGRPMVADFGIALAVRAAAGGRMTETGLSLGTPHYMSPEQATAEKELTGRSDVYSLATVLYEMLTGNPPHTGAAAQQIIMKIVTEDAVPVTKLRRNVPLNVAAAVGKALEKLPADRFETAKAFADALTSPAFALPGAARGARQGGYSGWRRYAGAIIGALAVVAVVTTIVAVRSRRGVVASSRSPPVERASVAVLPFVALSSGADDGHFADGLTEEILNSLAALPDLLVTARTSSFYFKGKGEFAMARRLSDHKVETDPLDPSAWSERAQSFIALGDFDAGENAISRGRAVAGDHPWLRGDELYLAIARRDRERVVALLKRPGDNPQRNTGWRDAYRAAVEGDYDRATRLAREIEAASPWPAEYLLLVYHETGDRTRARALTQRIDALTAGPAIFARAIAVSENMLYFDLADAPNFAARLGEARINRKAFRPMPRLSAGAGRAIR